MGGRKNGRPWRLRVRRDRDAPLPERMSPDVAWPDMDGGQGPVDWDALLEFDMWSINHREVVCPTCGREKRS